MRKDGQITHNKHKHIPDGEEQQRPDLRVRWSWQDSVQLCSHKVQRSCQTIDQINDCEYWKKIEPYHLATEAQKH